jgi:eukaryotic-like serine/threonine-protein kinase
MKDVLPEGLRIADRYVVEGRLGGGGHADVYRAADTRLDRPVAAKIFRAGADAADVRRFTDEARLLAGLSHPGLVTVYDSGWEEHRAFLVMQLIEGETLGDRLARGPLQLNEATRLGAQLADVLSYVHGRGIVHRDIKPSNVLLEPRGQAYLADFGISRLIDATRLTAAGQAIGTVAYMAPEQVTGRDIGPAVDVYALGLVLLECVTGRMEYEGTGAESALARLSRPPHIPPGLPEGLGQALLAMTARDPARRPPANHCVSLLADALSPRRQVPSPSPLPPTATLEVPTTSVSTLDRFTGAGADAMHQVRTAVRHRDPARVDGRTWLLLTGVAAAIVLVVALASPIAGGGQHGSTPISPGGNKPGRSAEPAMPPGPERLPDDLSELDKAVRP